LRCISRMCACSWWDSQMILNEAPVTNPTPLQGVFAQGSSVSTVELPFIKIGVGYISYGIRSHFGEEEDDLLAIHCDKCYKHHSMQDNPIWSPHSTISSSTELPFAPFRSRFVLLVPSSRGFRLSIWRWFVLFYCCYVCWLLVVYWFTIVVCFTIVDELCLWWVMFVMSYVSWSDVYSATNPLWEGLTPLPHRYRDWKLKLLVIYPSFPKILSSWQPTIRLKRSSL
jgi:hypothetical protein